MKKRIYVYILFLCTFFVAGCSAKPQDTSFTEVDVTDNSIYVDKESCSWMAGGSAGRTFILPINIVSEDTGLEYYFSVEDGGLRLKEQESGSLGQEIDSEQALKSGDIVCWVEKSTQGDYWIELCQGVTWADVRIEREGNIVGYAVIRLERRESGEPLGEVIKHIEFPVIDGKYQSVSVEYVESRIKALKQESENAETGIETAAETDIKDESVDEPAIVWNETDGDLAVTEQWNGNEQKQNGEGAHGLICLDAADEDVEYWFTIDDGILAADEAFAGENDGDGHNAPLILSGKASLHMSSALIQDGTRYRKYWMGDRTYINVVMYKDSHIVGYAVIELYFPEAHTVRFKCEASLIKQIVFPQVNGEYQNISEAYVWAEIGKVKEE